MNGLTNSSFSEDGVKAISLRTRRPKPINTSDSAGGSPGPSTESNQPPHPPIILHISTSALSGAGGTNKRRRRVISDSDDPDPGPSTSSSADSNVPTENPLQKHYVRRRFQTQVITFCCLLSDCYWYLLPLISFTVTNSFPGLSNSIKTAHDQGA